MNALIEEGTALDSSEIPPRSNVRPKRRVVAEKAFIIALAIVTVITLLSTLGLVDIGGSKDCKSGFKGIASGRIDNYTETI